MAALSYRRISAIVKLEAPNRFGPRLRTSSFVHLRQDGVSFLVSLAPELVRIIHWGEDLGEINNFEDYLAATTEPTAYAEGDSPDQPGLWREQARGSIGAPVLKGHRQGANFSPMFVLTNHKATNQELIVVGQDHAAGLSIHATGVESTELVNRGPHQIEIDHMANTVKVTKS